MGSTGSGFLGLARGMAEYLTYLLPTQDRRTIVKIIGDVLLRLNILQFSEKKNQYLFRGTYLPTYLTYLIQSSKNIEKKNPPSPAERATST